jgi:Zn-dependent protease
MTFIIVFVGWIFSLCLHEFSHALTAYYGGDTTVREKGYLTFNPLKYTHPLFSLFLPLLFLVVGGIGLPGGAVYIETWRLRSSRWVSAVAVAGPLSNLLLGAILAVILRFAPVTGGGVWPGLVFLALLQITAAALNLIPLPPFDGYAAIEPFLGRGIRLKMAATRGILVWIVFLILWYVPFINDLFWQLVFWIARGLGVPLSLAGQGLQLFQFWQQ